MVNFLTTSAFVSQRRVCSFSEKGWKTEVRFLVPTLTFFFFFFFFLDLRMATQVGPENLNS